jgi:hypothetical protein
VQAIFLPFADGVESSLINDTDFYAHFLATEVSSLRKPLRSLSVPSALYANHRRKIPSTFSTCDYTRYYLTMNAHHHSDRQRKQHLLSSTTVSRAITPLTRLSPFPQWCLASSGHYSRICKRQTPRRKTTGARHLLPHEQRSLYDGLHDKLVDSPEPPDMVIRSCQLVWLALDHIHDKQGYEEALRVAAHVVESETPISIFLAMH